MHLAFYLTYILICYLAFFLAYIYIYFYIYIYIFDIASDVLLGILSDVYSDIQSVILCGVLSDIRQSPLRSGRRKHAEGALIKCRDHLAYGGKNTSSSPSSPSPQAGEASIARMDKMRHATGPIPTAVLRRELQVWRCGRKRWWDDMAWKRSLFVVYYMLPWRSKLRFKFTYQRVTSC